MWWNTKPLHQTNVELVCCVFSSQGQHKCYVCVYACLNVFSVCVYADVHLGLLYVESSLIDPPYPLRQNLSIRSGITWQISKTGMWKGASNKDKSVYFKAIYNHISLLFLDKVLL